MFDFLAVRHEILAPQPRIEPIPPSLEGKVLNHWTSREIPLVALNAIVPVKVIWV